MSLAPIISKVSRPEGRSAILQPTIDGAIIVDDGYYNGFPIPHQFIDDGETISFYKKSSDHASKGPMIITRYSDGGDIIFKEQISIGGTPIETAALAFGVLASGRIIIGYQDDELYTSAKFAYSDDRGATWTASSTLSFGAGYSSSFSPVKMIVMPSGNILCPYYKFGIGGNPAIVGTMKSTDDGVSFAFDSVIFSHGGTGFGDDKGHEVAFCITDNTGSDATTKLIAVIRNADVVPYMHYKSADGGATWTTDTVTTDAAVGGPYNRHYIYKFGDFSNQQPVDLIVRSGTVYMVCGSRDETDGYKIRLMTASTADAYANDYNGWTSPSDISGTLNAYTLGSEIDCGYPVCFEDWEGKIFCQYYDISTETLDPMIATDRVWVKQLKIVD